MAKISTYINGLTEDTTPATNDTVMTYDTSATALKKVTLANLLAGVSAGLGADGWAGADAMAYASADAPTFTVTMTGDQTAKYYPGMRIKLTQTTVKYFIITAVAYSSSTTITLYGGTDYTLANAAITSPYYSSAKAPAGFPLDPAKWTVEVTNTSLNTQATPTQNTWYNLGSVTINIPIGIWRVVYRVCAQVNDAATTEAEAIATTLSTGNNSESDTAFTATATVANALSCRQTFMVEKHLTLAAKTAYYLNTRTTSPNMDQIHNVNSSAGVPLAIRAICVYL